MNASRMVRGDSDLGGITARPPARPGPAAIQVASGSVSRLARCGRAGRAEVHGPGAPRCGPEHVQADVRGDPVEPGAQRRAALEAVDAAPGADQRLLYRVLGLERRAEHAVAVGGQLAAILLELLFDVGGGVHRDRLLCARA